MLPYQQIIDNPERKWHRQLLDRLIAPGVGEEELEEIADCLERLSDHRTVEPLFAILTDAGYSNAVREAAQYVLANIPNSVPQGVYRGWLSGDDALLQVAAIAYLEPKDADLLLPIVKDPSHPNYRYGISELGFGYEKMEYQQLAIDALSHPDAAVRERAASVLVWQEPNAAEDGLLAATHDPVEAVVDAAVDTLQYYATQRVFRRVNMMEGYSVEDIRDDLIYGLRFPDRQKHIRRWLTPIWDMLQVTSEELAPRQAGEPIQRDPPRGLSVAEIEEFIDNPDLSPLAISDFFWHTDWLAVPESSRDRLAQKFVAYPDHMIRERSALALEKWEHIDGLVQLFHAPEFPVMKSATYHLSQVHIPSRQIAAMLWDHLSSPDAWSTHAAETLDAYVVHADPAEALQNLIAITENRDQTETLRYHAISNLEELNARDAVEHLLPLVLDPPSVTWGFHDILLGAAYKFKLKPPPLAQYLSVDNAHLQMAIAPFVD